MAACAQLMITLADGTERSVPLEGTRVTLGRSEMNTLSFPGDALLSRRHLLLERRGSRWFALDLGSSNGTTLNGAPLCGEQELNDGDCLIAGTLRIRFAAPEAAPSEPPVAPVFIEERPEETLGATTVMMDLNRVLSPGAPGEPPRAPEERRVRALIDAGRELSMHRPLGELFEVILKLAADAVGARRGLLLTWDGERLIARAAQGEGFRISTAVRDKILNERASLLVLDASLDDALRTSSTIVQQRVRSLMAVPLQTKDRVIGLLYLDSPDLVHPFTEEDLSLMTVMANIAAIRIEHARLMEVEQAERLLAHELEQAAEIQKGLLPARVPQIPGFEIAAETMPCKGVGGDYYDFFLLPDGSWGLVVADVAGKGLAASLLASSVQARLQVLSQQTAAPGELAARLNDSLQGRCPENRFVTFFLCALDPASGLLRYSNAGHNPALLLQSNGRLEKLTEGGIFAGCLPGLRYSEGCIQMEPGDLLVIYTDGVTEAHRSEAEEFFGDERFEALLRSRMGRPAASLLHAVEDALREFLAGDSPPDDVTLVTLRRLPAADSAGRL